MTPTSPGPLKQIIAPNGIDTLFLPDDDPLSVFLRDPVKMGGLSEVWTEAPSQQQQAGTIPSRDALREAQRGVEAVGATPSEDAPREKYQLGAQRHVLVPILRCADSRPVRSYSAANEGQADRPCITVGREGRGVAPAHFPDPCRIEADDLQSPRIRQVA